MLIAAGALLAAMAVAHGWTLADRYFLDDHFHQQRLAAIGWSPAELLAVTNIALDDFVHCWWQEQSTRWRYTRPVSVLLMKMVHTLSGGNAVAQHGASLLMHLLTSVMVLHLALRLTRNRFWSLFGALLFAMYTHSIIPVGWLAAQNVILQAMLSVAALLLYARASGLSLYPSGEMATDAVPGVNRPAFAGVVVLVILAMLSREAGALMPAMLIALDLAYGGRRHVWARRRTHLLLLLIAAAFLLWRLTLCYTPLPDFYMRRPGESGFVLWCVAKLMHYLCSAVWLTPMSIGPTGRYDPFREAPGDCILMFAILFIMSLGYMLACRRIRGYWFWPLWILFSVLPGVPIMATPHMGYMAGVGFAIAMILGPALRHRARPASIGRWSPVVAGWFMFATLVYVPISRLAWTGMQAAEAVTVEKLVTLPGPDERTERVFFINLPFVNVYAPVQLADQWGDAGSNASYHVLTYAPQLLFMQSRCAIEQIDDHRFELSVEQTPYFSGALGRFFIEAMRSGKTLHAGDVVRAAPFDVEIVDADDAGVWRLRFAFPRPLADASYRFYASTTACPATRIKFRRGRTLRSESDNADSVASLQAVDRAARLLAQADASAAAVLFSAARSGSARIADRAESALLRVTRPVAISLAAPVAIQQLLNAADRSAADWARLHEWWGTSIDDARLRELWLERDRFAALRETSRWPGRVLDWIGRAIRTDVYFTGPPYPGPRD
ncbi:MAG: hypothetical protein V3T70_03745 [Phycisphaerae bacterium]